MKQNKAPLAPELETCLYTANSERFNALGRVDCCKWGKYDSFNKMQANLTVYLKLEWC